MLKKIIATAIFTTQIYAQTATQASSATLTTPIAPETPNDEKFLPYMAEHALQGCPTNSVCSPEAGQERGRWLDFLNKLGEGQQRKAEALENFKNKNGVPIEVWATEEAKMNKSLIYWDSPCPHHQKTPDTFFIGQIFTKNTKVLSTVKGIIPETILLLEKNMETVKTYYVPRGEIPSYLEDEAMVFLKEEDGNYIGIAVYPEGNIKITPIQAPEIYPQTTDCPKAFSDKFKNIQIKNIDLYKNFHCKSIYNIRTKSTQSILINFSCN